MKKINLLLLTCFPILVSAQITFDKGYFINNNDEKVICLIKNEDWSDNPIKIEYQLSEQGITKSITIDDIKEFGIDKTSKYIRYKGKVEVSSDELNKLTEKKEPIFEVQTIFLQVLVDGTATLYYYHDKEKTRFFYHINNGEIESLIYKTYLVKKDETDKILENATFRRQLWVRMQCESMSMQSVEKLGYYSKELINYFIKYHKCIGEKAISYKRGKFNYNLGLKVGVSQQRFNFSSIQFTDWTIDGVSARFGIENELIFPFNGKKWALLFEPTYQYFSDSATIKKGNTIFSDLYEIDYQSIELQLGIRYYIFLNEKSKFFLNALFVNDINLNGNFMITEGIGNQLKVDLNSFPNYAFGVGYKYKNVASLELKYQTLRNLTYNFVGGNSTYRNISLSACYYFL